MLAFNPLAKACFTAAVASSFKRNSLKVSPSLNRTTRDSSMAFNQFDLIFIISNHRYELIVRIYGHRDFFEIRCIDAESQEFGHQIEKDLDGLWFKILI